MKRIERIKVMAGVECVILAMSLVIPLMPSRSGSGGPVRLPPDAATYVLDVLFCLAVGTGILLALLGIGWIVAVRMRNKT